MSSLGSINLQNSVSRRLQLELLVISDLLLPKAGYDAVLKMLATSNAKKQHAIKSQFKALPPEEQKPIAAQFFKIPGRNIDPKFLPTKTLSVKPTPPAPTPAPVFRNPYTAVLGTNILMKDFRAGATQQATPAPSQAEQQIAASIAAETAKVDALKKQLAEAEAELKKQKELEKEIKAKDAQETSKQTQERKMDKPTSSHNKDRVEDPDSPTTTSSSTPNRARSSLGRLSPSQDEVSTNPLKMSVVDVDLPKRLPIPKLPMLPDMGR